MSKFKKVLEDFGIVIALAVLLFGLGAGIVAYNQWAYGDWTCIFKHCVEANK